MFKCQSCLKQIEQNQGQSKIVTETREKLYLNSFKTYSGTRTTESKGWEIVAEKKVCTACATAHEVKLAAAKLSA